MPNSHPQNALRDTVGNRPAWRGVGIAHGMTRSQSFVFGLILAAAAFWSLTALFGCAASPPIDRQASLSPAGERRSLATDAPSLVSLRPTPAEQAAYGTPWYASRHDRPAAYVTGTESATIQRSVTITSDRLSTFNGRVFDDVDIRRRTISIQEQVTR